MHGEQEARRLLALGRAVLEVGDRQLQEGAKGMPEKEALAWWIGQRTTVSRRWVGERLWMGDESRVSHAIRRVEAGRDSQLAKLKARLVQAQREENGLEK